MHRFFGGKARGKALGPSARVASLPLCEEAIRDTRMALEREPKARDVNDVDADADLSPLLDRHGLGEVARAIDVSSKPARHGVGEQL